MPNEFRYNVNPSEVVLPPEPALHLNSEEVAATLATRKEHDYAMAMAAIRLGVDPAECGCSETSIREARAASIVEADLAGRKPHGNRKLTNTQEIDMARRFVGGEAIVALAERFGVSPQYVGTIMHKHGIRRDTQETDHAQATE